MNPEMEFLIRVQKCIEVARNRIVGDSFLTIENIRRVIRSDNAFDFSRRRTLDESNEIVSN